MSVSENQIVVYQPNETVRLEVRLENEVQTKEPQLQSIIYQNKFWDAMSLKTYTEGSDPFAKVELK